MKNMARRFLLSTLSFIFAIGLLPASPVKAATTIYVPDNFPTIQAAVNAASAGDTIVVRTGTYTENVKVNKSVTIKSNNGAEATIIQAANPSDHVFEVTADYVSIDGFMIRGADGKDSTYLDGMYLGSAGIYLKNATSCTIINNQITENTDGIFCDYSNSVSILENNVNLNNVHGIWWLNSSNNKINSNNVTNCIFGISCAYTSGDEIAQNMVKDNESNAISLQDSADSKVLANNVTNNGYGIDLFSRVRNNLISGNYITNSKNYGIGLSEASNNTVCNNYILNSVWWGIHIQFSPDANTLYLNNFINNNINVLFNQSTVMNWHSSEQITYTYNSKTFRDYLGNYWSNYTGSDVNGDGIGDTPYSIDSDRDNYPLVEPFENYGIGAAPKQMTKPTDVEGTIIPFRGYYDIVDIPKGDPRLNTTAYRYFHEWIGEKTKNGIVYEIYRVYHEGIDVIVPRGTVVKAATSGKVVWVDRVDDSRAGRWVWIEHGNIGKLDGTAVTKISTRYLHLDTIDPNITIGKTVAQGTVIGTVGNTGCPTTTPHLHFEVQGYDASGNYVQIATRFYTQKGIIYLRPSKFYRTRH